MSSVNPSQPDPSLIKVTNLYRKLGIPTNTAIKPPLSKDASQKLQSGPRRQTMFVSKPSNTVKSLERQNTSLAGPRRNSFTQIEIPVQQKQTVQRNLTPKSRFINSWIQTLKDKENEATN